MRYEKCILNTKKLLGIFFLNLAVTRYMMMMRMMMMVFHSCRTSDFCLKCEIAFRLELGAATAASESTRVHKQAIIKPAASRCLKKSLRF